MRILLLVAIALCYSAAAVGVTASVPYYCNPDQSECWPQTKDWKKLALRLTGKLHLFDGGVMVDYQPCLDAGTNSTAIREAGNGICMMYHDCRYEFCNAGQPENVNLPAAAVEAITVKDLRFALRFAKIHRLAVTIKTSGHNYAGSSTGKNSLLILTKSLESNGVRVLEGYDDKCGGWYDNVAEIGGGNTWQDVYDVIGDDYNVVGGFGDTVSALGGWLQGGGLSPLVRKYGLGIDQVIDMEVMLPDGRSVLTSACKNQDLFYALRGGGGGTYGVVLKARYKLYPVEPVTELLVLIDTSNPQAAGPVIDAWLHFWITRSASPLPNEWGGYWSNSVAFLYYTGEPAGSQPLIQEITDWRDALEGSMGDLVVLIPQTAPSYVSVRALRTIDPSSAGNEEYWIGSRYVSQSQVEQDPEGVIAAYGLATAAQPVAFNYMMGGATQEVSTDETAIHPLAREALWQLTFLFFLSASQADAGFQALRDAFPDSASGYNHAYKYEPNWEEAFWGDNYSKLRLLKKKFDPENVLNCWHCVGFQGTHFDGKVTQDASRDNRCARTLCLDTQRCINGECV